MKFLAFLFAELVFVFFIGSMVCYVCSYKRLNCVDGCPFARYFHEDNISTDERISKFQPPHEIKEMLMSCSLEEGRNCIGHLLADAEAKILNLELCNPCKFLEVYDCLGEQCEFHKHFDTEASLAKLVAIVNLKTKKFFLSKFRRAGRKG